MNSALCSIHASDLRRSRALFVGEVGEQVQQRLVGADVVLRVAGDDPTDVVAGVRVVGGDLACQQMKGQTSPSFDLSGVVHFANRLRSPG